MTYQAGVEILKKELKDIYPIEEIRHITYILFEDLFQVSRIKLHTEPQTKLTDTQEQKLINSIIKMQHHYPVQYITGRSWFYDIPFTVNESVLIPRPETEELVEWVLDTVKNDNSNQSILDVGTGSGCIPVSIAKHTTNKTITAFDIEKKALQTAKKNALDNNATIDFFEFDIFQWENQSPPNAPFDVIVSNPPYIRSSEKKYMEKNVLDFEPDSALFVSDEEPLIFYKTIIEFAVQTLRDKCTLFFEINESLGLEIITLLKSYNITDVMLKKDMKEKDRMIKAVINHS